MHIALSPVGTLFSSDDMMQGYESYSDDPAWFSSALVRATLRYEYERLPREELAILHAHGWRNEDGLWVYRDGSQILFVRDWVREQDGKHKFLFLFSCESEVFQAKRSFLLIPDQVSFYNPDPKDPYRGGQRPMITFVPPRRVR